MINSIRSFGNTLQEPIYALSEAVIEAWTFAEINPELRTQYDNPYLETARRVRALTLDSAVVLVLSLTLGTLSIAIRALANQLDSTGFTTKSGTLPPTTTPIQSILSFNVNMYPGGLPLVLGGVDPASYRYDELCTLIRTQDPDVVCLQEISTQAAYHLVDQFENDYAHFIFDGGTPALFMDAGLFIASKQRPNGETQFIEFTEEGRQNGIHRGFFVVPFEDKVLAVTHLEPGDGPDHAAIRESELNTILSHLNQHYPDMPTVLCGDLNIRRTLTTQTDEFSAVTAFNEQGFHPTTVDEKTVTDLVEATRDGIQDFSEEPVQLDYFATTRLTPPNVEVLNAINLEHPTHSLSDHQALLATFSTRSC
ncbi:MAG: hypothetical protein SP1CHLAM54_14010 [Chlamydiia bacterium]|nr:hypothetical protein [Chlamydiia bacterium]MCH9616293.1 hypothetical protein [Chlamydiia bacterium]MCH9629721.1 hypothetical protein [Chlamydiia bacterium]